MSLGSPFKGVNGVFVFVSLFTSRLGCSLRLFSKCLCDFFAQVTSPHHSDQMSRRELYGSVFSKVSSSGSVSDSKELFWDS